MSQKRSNFGRLLQIFMDDHEVFRKHRLANEGPICDEAKRFSCENVVTLNLRSYKQAESAVGVAKQEWKCGRKAHLVHDSGRFSP